MSESTDADANKAGSARAMPNMLPWIAINAAALLAIAAWHRDSGLDACSPTWFRLALGLG